MPILPVKAKLLSTSAKVFIGSVAVFPVTELYVAEVPEPNIGLAHSAQGNTFFNSSTNSGVKAPESCTCLNFLFFSSLFQLACNVLLKYGIHTCTLPLDSGSSLLITIPKWFPYNGSFGKLIIIMSQ